MDEMISYNIEKNDLHRMPKEALIDRVNALESELKQLRIQKRQVELLNLPWAGNLGQWYWAPKTDQVSFNPKKATDLGFHEDELPSKVGHRFFTDRLHPQDYDRVMKNMLDHLEGKTDAYEVEYRIRSKGGKYLRYYDRGVVVSRDENGQAEMLVGIVFNVTERYRLAEELMATNEKLEIMVQKDYLTGIYNRRFFMESLNKEILRSQRRTLPLSLIMCDIDDFKRVNDTYGHNIGDLVIIGFAQGIQNRLRATDVVARWGGEEFIILLLDTNLDQVKQIAEDVRKTIEETEFPKDIKATASFGVLEIDPFGSIMDQLTELDQKMYKAKKAGKNQVC